MKTYICLLLCAFAVACSDPSKPLAPLHHSSVGGEGGSGGDGVGGTGGSGGETPDAGPDGDAGCDPWTEAGCCEVSTYCPNTTCEVDMKLCGGVCMGKPTPIKDKPCGTGNMGTCMGTECVMPDPDAGQ